MGVGALLRTWFIVLCGILLSGCDAIFPEPDVAVPISRLDVEPRVGELEVEITEVIGPVTQVVSGEVEGEAFTLSAYDSVDGPCLSLEPMQYGGIACGAPQGVGPAEAATTVSVAQSGLPNGVHAIDGIASADVASVWAETESGGRAHAVVVPIEVEDGQFKAFLVFLPAGVHETAIVAADADGRVLKEMPLVSIAPGGPGAPVRPTD